MTKKQVIQLTQRKDQTKEEALAEFNSKSEFLSTAVKESFDIGLVDDFSFQSTMQVLEKTIQQIQSGDLSKIEEMYISQAVALEVMFASLARRAKAQDKLLQYETHMRLALKAQNQCRATLQALVQLKQPSQTTFVKQANIAQGHQQVNNLPEKNITPQNELLKGNYAQLDTGTTTTPKGADTTLEALGEIHRREDAGRKGKII
ncbi:hypothetical protein G6672_00185 [Polynucleobacter paneuropaeus]|nr:hypothetical protein [Polynucleobacter paneuropaeus]MBT8635672.1 hypothetical protein [Polynucleobacter paneuropaeus]MBT8637479.1 hypothetical protein [Polynucleobacter paneuropaeus]